MTASSQYSRILPLCLIPGSVGLQQSRYWPPRRSWWPISRSCRPDRFLKALNNWNAFRVYMANGIAEVLPLQPFPIRVMNTSHSERRIQKVMVLGHALPNPTRIVSLVDDVPEDGTAGEQGASQTLSRDAEQYAQMQNPPPCRIDRMSMVNCGAVTST
jgi:hypothetical protein